MNRKKMLFTAIVLTLVILIGGLLAYFTDTDTKRNVFTLGLVDITLTEPKWDSDTRDGWDYDGEGSWGYYDASIGIAPGTKYWKDPTIENTGANDAYVFLKVEIPVLGSTELFTISNRALDENGYPELDDNDDPIVTSLATGWKQVSKTLANGKYTYVLVYGTEGQWGIYPTALAPDETTTAFNTVTFANLTGNEANIPGTVNIDVKAYAIQTNIYEENLYDVDADAVWDLVKDL